MGNNNDLPNNLSAFVCDAESKAVIDAAIKEMNLAYTTCEQAEINVAVDFLKKNRTPKILLVDFSNSELPLTDLERIKDVTSPDMDIIAIGEKNDVGLFRSFTQSGILDYIVKPLNIHLLIKSLTTIISGVSAYASEEARQGQMISFVGTTGGIGTSTLAANCSWQLANELYKKTLLIDSDYQFGNVNLLLGLPNESSYLETLDSPEKIDDYFIDTALKKHSQRLFYLGGLTDISRPFDIDEASFEKMVSMVKTQFNYLIVDLKLNVTSLNRVLLSNSKTIVIISGLSTADAYNAARFIEFLKQDSKEKNIVVVINKIGEYSTGAISRDAFEKSIGMQVNHVLHFDNYLPYGAANVGQPIASLDCSLNQALRNLSNNILGNNIEPQNKMKEVYEESLLSKEGIKDMLDKVGLGKYIFGE